MNTITRKQELENLYTIYLENDKAFHYRYWLSFDTCDEKRRVYFGHMKFGSNAERLQIKMVRIDTLDSRSVSPAQRIDSNIHTLFSLDHSNLKVVQLILYDGRPLLWKEDIGLYIGTLEQKGTLFGVEHLYDDVYCIKVPSPSETPMYLGIKSSADNNGNALPVIGVSQIEKTNWVIKHTRTYSNKY